MKLHRVLIICCALSPAVWSLISSADLSIPAIFSIPSFHAVLTYYHDPQIPMSESTSVLLSLAFPPGADLKMRVVWATVFLVVAKLVLVVVPYFFKWATDALSGDGAPLPDLLPTFLLAPVMLVVAYNVVRIVQVGFNQLRDALFARVGQHAVRQLAYKTFVHLHGLSLRFHLERRTGGLSRVIERGVKGIAGALGREVHRRQLVARRRSAQRAGALHGGADDADADSSDEEGAEAEPADAAAAGALRPGASAFSLLSVRAVRDRARPA